MIRDPVIDPLVFDPILKSLIWGGRRLGELLGKPIGDAATIAESWEISDHHDDVSRVRNGKWRGYSLRDLLRDHKIEILGPALARFDQFPLLVKFLDAHQALSVQVHPDDALGRRLVHDNGKTEAWVIIHSNPGSRIYAGLNRGVIRSDLAAAIDAKHVEPLLHSFHPEPGDCIFIPAGTVHAIGAGIVLAEIQQMSDATFRIDDWGRLGADGKPRKLHIAESLEATNFAAGPTNSVRVAAEPIPGGTREQLVTCSYFRLQRLRFTGATQVGSAERFTIVIGLGGEAVIEQPEATTLVGLGDTVLLPAALGSCFLKQTGDTPATVLTCVVP